MESTLRNLGGIEPTPNSDSKMEEHPSKQPLLPNFPSETENLWLIHSLPTTIKDPNYLSSTVLGCDLIWYRPPLKEKKLSCTSYATQHRKQRKHPPGPRFFVGFFFWPPALLAPPLAFSVKIFPRTLLPPWNSKRKVQGRFGFREALEISSQCQLWINQPTKTSWFFDGKKIQEFLSYLFADKCFPE